MKKMIISSIFATVVLVSCSTVSSIIQNTFPFNTNFVIAEKSSPNTQLTTVGLGNSINQITGTTNKVQNIKLSNATATVTSNEQSIGIFKSIEVYLSDGSGNEILVASREDISNNIGTSLALDIDNTVNLDAIMKSGNVQEKIVYELKSSPVADIKLKTSLQFSSEAIPNN
ncbi:hypothetical protein [Frigoriflavimonas asaccharolytica]|uniref:Lipoprotein n=1 Tax=Frigoriflavimonas asaccharolytica TaxID=2735899 RepID=A0A8J8G8A8_9FLAO|nr:hypothetical protein [Frigoriflavimonas asaccharolytica]NRS92525.1 hypothetical protein [Frigoriflavimonas asaccharolytica]